MWFDIRMVIDELEIRVQELLAVAKQCLDELQVMLFVPSGVGEDTQIAKELQDRVFMETGIRNKPTFAKGDALATGWIGVPPVSKLRDIKYSWQSTVHVLGMRAVSGHQIYTRLMDAGELALRISMKVSDAVLARDVSLHFKGCEFVRDAGHRAERFCEHQIMLHGTSHCFITLATRRCE